MGSLPLQIVRVDQDQRGDSDDFNYTNSLALDNLYLALKNLLGTGWLQPGAMEWVGPGMECYLRTPVGAITAEGLAILADDYAITPDAGDADDPRIDLVSIGWQSASAAQVQKWKINQSTEVPYQDDVYTRVQHTPVITLTKGTPASSPVRPATPANHVALWEIYVAEDATTLSSASFTRIPSSVGLANRIATATWVGDAVQYASPYVSPNIIEVETPSGTVTVFLAQVHFKFWVAAGQSIVAQIEDAVSGAVVGSTWLTGQDDLLFGGLNVIGYVAGPTTGRRTYRLRMTWTGAGLVQVDATTAQRSIALTL